MIIKSKIFGQCLLIFFLSNEKSQTQKLLSDIQNKIRKSSFDVELQTTRVSILKLLFKCAKYSLSVRSFDTRKSWGPYMNKEVIFPDDSVKSITSLRQNISSKQYAKLQFEFLQGNVLPMFTVLQQIIPSAETFVNQIQKNIQSWKNVALR